MAEEEDFATFTSDLAYGHVTFVVAKRPNESLDVEFERFDVDGTPVPVGRPGPVPGDQGSWIDVGAYPTGKAIEIRWQVHTGIRVPDREVIFGHCPNGKLTKFVRLERRKVEPFETYTGVFSVVPERA